VYLRNFILVAVGIELRDVGIPFLKSFFSAAFRLLRWWALGRRPFKTKAARSLSLACPITWFTVLFLCKKLVPRIAPTTRRYQILQDHSVLLNIKPV
jgi:hypothetical protein